MELVRLCGGTYLLKGRVNCGYYGGTLIDAGLDADVARRIFSLLDGEGLEIESIVLTHAHADHFGGARFLKERTGASVFASSFEAAAIENPLLEPLSLFAGASPPDELKNKFLMAEPCEVDAPLSRSLGDLEIWDLPGHSIAQVGVLTPDDILFCADAFFTEEFLEKFKFTFLVDVSQTVESLERLKGVDAQLVQSHGGPVENAEAAIDHNLARIDKNVETIRGLADLPIHEINNHVMGLIDSKSVMQYFLTNTIVHAYLKHLFRFDFDGELKLKDAAAGI